MFRFASMLPQSSAGSSTQEAAGRNGLNHRHSNNADPSNVAWRMHERFICVSLFI